MKSFYQLLPFFITLAVVISMGQANAQIDQPTEKPTIAVAADDSHAISKNLERTPASLFKLLKTPQAESNLPSYVAFAQWDKINDEYLKKLPTEQATQLYQRILSDLATSTQSSPTEKRLLSLNDVISISDLSPTLLTPNQIKQLASIVRANLSAGRATDSFLAHLHSGTRHFGKDSAQKKEATGMLLAFSGLTKEAVDFFPGLEEAKKLKNYSTVNLHIAKLIATGQKTSDPKPIALAWSTTEWLLTQPDLPKALIPELTKHTLALIPNINPQLRKSWLKNMIAQNPKALSTLLETLYNQSTIEQKKDDFDRRNQNLLTWKTLENDLFALNNNQYTDWTQMAPAFHLLWIQEVNTYFTGLAKYLKLSHRDKKKATRHYLSEQQLLASIPDISDTRTYLNQDAKSRILAASIRLYIQNNKTSEAMAAIEKHAKHFPKESILALDQLLIVWGRVANPSRISIRKGQQKQYNQTILLTHARQVKNISDLSTLYQKIKAMKIGDVSDKAIIFAFTSCYSDVEVFSKEDIESVLGKIDTIPLSRISLLASNIYSRLQQSWADEKLQLQFKTGRTAAELKKSISDGYTLLVTILDSRLKKDEDPALRQLLGDYYFGWATFEREQAITKKELYRLSDFSSKINKAFSNYEQAVATYKKSAPSLQENAYSIAPYARWFDTLIISYAASKGTNPTDVEAWGVDKIREEILSTHNPSKHMAMFTKHVTTRIASLEPLDKQAYVEAAFKIIQNDPSADSIKKQIEFYQELITEVKLQTSLMEQSRRVGASSFGIMLSLHHTDRISRESKGFSKYISPDGPYNKKGYLLLLSNEIKNSFSNQFDIKSITFCSPQNRPRPLIEGGIPKKGWSETPLAYVYLKSRDASVDKIPSTLINLDFLDFQGEVTIPIASNELVINSQVEQTIPTPPELKVFQTLNAHNAKNNVVQLEIRATAHGIIPPLREILDLHFDDFKIVNEIDETMQVNKFIATDQETYPDVERNWTITLSLPDATPGKPSTFNFPTAKDPSVPMEYHRYLDADLKQVEKSIPFNAKELTSSYAWIWWLLIIPVVGIIAYFYFRKKSAHDTEESATSHYSVPESLNAFTCAALLMTIRQDGVFKEDPDAITDLNTDIQAIEQSQFAPETHQDLDYATIAKKWVNAANQASLPTHI